MALSPGYNDPGMSGGKQVPPGGLLGQPGGGSLFPNPATNGSTATPPGGFSDLWNNFWNGVWSGFGVVADTATGGATDSSKDTVQLWPFGPSVPKTELVKLAIGIPLYGVLLIGIANFVRPGSSQDAAQLIAPEPGADPDAGKSGAASPATKAEKTVEDNPELLA